MDPRQVFHAYDRDGAGHDGWGRHCSACGAIYPDPQGAVRTCPECGRRWFRNPAPSVAIIVAEGDRFVLCRRKHSGLRGGLWCLPSGYVEFGEDYLTAARREVQEETGLEVAVEAIISVVTNYLTPSVHSLCVVLLARPLGGTLSASDDVVEARWLHRDDALPQMAFEADTHIIERYFATRLVGAPVDRRYAGPGRG